MMNYGEEASYAAELWQFLLSSSKWFFLCDFRGSSGGLLTSAPKRDLQIICKFKKSWWPRDTRVYCKCRFCANRPDLLRPRKGRPSVWGWPVHVIGVPPERTDRPLTAGTSNFPIRNFIPAPHEILSLSKTVRLRLVLLAHPDVLQVEQILQQAKNLVIPAL